MNFEPFHGRLQLMFLFLVAALLHVAAHIARETENDVKWQAS
jgi:hypothetical protein